LIRIAHYLNQFFAGIGGEDKADAPFEVRPGAVGPGRALQMLLGERGEVVTTLVCGDNAFHADPDANLEAVVAAVAATQPDLFVAGPAFNAGRYGLACAAVCAAVKERLGIRSITGMYPEAPAVDIYRSRVVMVATGDSAGSMQHALTGIVEVGLRLVEGAGLRPAADEGRIPMGFRRSWPAEAPAGPRAVAMLVAKLRGEPYVTEVALPEQAEPVAPAPPVGDLATAVVALVTEGGLVPEDNPDRIESSSATRWARYPLTMLEHNQDPTFRSIHAGYDSQWVDADPDRMVPIDALRALAAEGVIGGIHDYFYVTTGTGTTVAHAERMGEEIARQLVADGVQAVIATST
jgi:glycine reductase